MKAELAPLTQSQTSLWDIAVRSKRLLLSASASFTVPQPITVLVGHFLRCLAQITSLEINSVAVQPASWSELHFHSATARATCLNL